MNDDLPTATYLGPARGFAVGDARLYALSRPAPSFNARKTCDQVIVHVRPTDDDQSPGDTVVLPARDGLLETLTPLPGSTWRCADHARALRGLGYRHVGRRA